MSAKNGKIGPAVAEISQLENCMSNWRTGSTLCQSGSDANPDFTHFRWTELPQNWMERWLMMGEYVGQVSWSYDVWCCQDFVHRQTDRQTDRRRVKHNLRPRASHSMAEVIRTNMLWKFPKIHSAWSWTSRSIARGGSPVQQKLPKFKRSLVSN